MTPEDYTTIVRDGDVARAMYDLKKAPVCADIQGEIVGFAVGGTLFVESTLQPWAVHQVHSLFAQHDLITIKSEANSDASGIFDAVNYGELTPEKGAAQLFALRVKGEK